MSTTPNMAHAIIAPNTKPLLIEFLLDETGSMTSCASATIAGFNDFLTDQRKAEGICHLTLTKFDSNGLRTPYIDLPLSLVPTMTPNMFNPGASTNLRDAIGRRIADLKERLANWTVRPDVLFIVMTDGEDNASHNYGERGVRDLLERQMAEGWTFVYLGANQNANNIALRLGFPKNNVKAFASSEMHRTMVDLSASTTTYRSSRAYTTTSDTDYFTR